MDMLQKRQSVVTGPAYMSGLISRNQTIDLVRSVAFMCYLLHCTEF